MTRRDRTTGLPTQSRLNNSAEKRNFFKSLQDGRYALIAATVLLFLFVVGFFAYRFYEKDNWGGKTILVVGSESFSLRYYADRFFYFRQSNPSVGIPILQESLLFTLENEALVKIIASERGIVVNDDVLEKAIEALLGVPKKLDGNSNKNFEIYLNNQLEITGMERSSFERLISAIEVERLLLDDLKQEVSVTGVMLTYRSVAVRGESDARDIYVRVQDGEDMGLIAQTESLNRAERQNDGLVIKPLGLVAEEILDALEKLEIGGPPSEPIQLDENIWIVVRYENRQLNQSYSTEHINALTENHLANLVRSTRTRVPIKRNLDSVDIELIEEHVRLE